MLMPPTWTVTLRVGSHSLHRLGLHLATTFDRTLCPTQKRSATPTWTTLL